MKVGLSFSLCVRDIITAQVPESDVLVITTGTDFDPHNDQQWGQIYRGYELGWSVTGHTESEFRDLSTRLYDLGRIHQPRQFDRLNRRNWSQVFWPSLVGSHADRFRTAKQSSSLGSLEQVPGSQPTQWCAGAGCIGLIDP